jgi:hypothetical protein
MIRYGQRSPRGPSHMVCDQISRGIEETQRLNNL